MNRPAAGFRYRTYLIVAAVGLVLLCVAFVGASATETSCGTCHSDVTAHDESSTHSQVACAGCHASNGSLAFALTEAPRMGVHWLAGHRVGDTPVSETAAASCLGCHSGILEAASPGKSGLRINHEACAPGATCDSCHSGVGHPESTRLLRQPVMEDCVLCHLSDGASIDCEKCHVAEVDRETRLKTGPWQVTHGAQWRVTHGMGTVETCVVCHPRDYCARCHGVAVPHTSTFGTEHGPASLSSGARCTQCHESKKFCNDCHGVEMPHPEGFLAVHAKRAGDVDNPACIKCHAVEDCELCHVKHTHPGGARGIPVPPRVPSGGAAE